MLVEGPADATGLIPLLLDAETVPPVALYAYRAAGVPGAPPAAEPGGRGAAAVRAVYYPFCDYSPEYVALKAGQEVGAAPALLRRARAAVLALAAPGARPADRRTATRDARGAWSPAARPAAPDGPAGIRRRSPPRAGRGGRVRQLRGVLGGRLRAGRRGRARPEDYRTCWRRSARQARALHHGGARP